MEVAAECITKVPSEAAGRIRWTIERWGALPCSQGEPTYSTVMECAENHWQLEVYPGGDADSAVDTPEARAQRKEHVAAFIWYKGPASTAKTKFVLRLANQLGKPDKTVMDSTVFSGIVPQPSGTFDALGSHMLVKRDVLEDETYGFKINDRVILEADITTYGDLETTSQKAPSLTPSDTLKSDLSQMLATGAFSDVTVTIKCEVLQTNDAATAEAQTALDNALAAEAKELGLSRSEDESLLGHTAVTTSRTALLQRRKDREFALQACRERVRDCRETLRLRTSQRNCPVSICGSASSSASRGDSSDSGCDDATSGCSSSGSSSSSSSCGSSSSSSGSGERTFHVHAQILKARSAYFRAMLSVPMSEAATRRITECDVQASVFEEVLNYMYTDTLSDGATEAMGEWLLLAANKYGLEALKQMCEGQLCRDLAVENVSVRLVLADQADADELKEACLGFIKFKAAEVMQTEGWAQVATRSGGALALEVLQAVAGAPRAAASETRKRPSPDAAGLSSKDAIVAAVDEMSASAMRSALAGRGLDTSGHKSELAERLKAAIQTSSD